jgi:hypothetical protein
MSPPAVHAPQGQKDEAVEAMQASSTRKNVVVQQANDAYQNQVSSQISRITAELKRMEDLLSFGLVDRRVLTDFRYAIDRVRSTGWQVERWLDGDERGLSVLLAEERIRLVTRMATQLAAETALIEKQNLDVRALRTALGKLDQALETVDSKVLED